MRVGLHSHGRFQRNAHHDVRHHEELQSTSWDVLLMMRQICGAASTHDAHALAPPGTRTLSQTRWGASADQTLAANDVICDSGSMPS